MEKLQSRYSLVYKLPLKLIKFNSNSLNTRCTTAALFFETKQEKSLENLIYLTIFTVNKKVSGVIIHTVGDLKAVSMSNLLRLEGCIQVLHRNSSLWPLRFLTSTDTI